MSKKNVIIGLFIFFIIGLFLFFKYVDIKRISDDAIKFKNEYENLNGTKNDSGKSIRNISIPYDNPFVYASEADIVKKVKNKESFLVYFGFAKCPWCRSVLPNLVKALHDNDVDVIYYVDVLDIRDVKEIDDDGNIKNVRDGSRGYMELIDLFSNVLTDYTLTDKKNSKVSAGEKRIYAPNVVAVSSGKAVKLVEGISKKQNDPYMKLTKDMNNESYKEFECVINCFLEEKKMCTNDKKC